MGIEDRIFELFGEGAIFLDIAPRVMAEFGVDEREAWDLMSKVFRERGTPQQIRTRRAIEALGRIRFV